MDFKQSKNSFSESLTQGAPAVPLPDRANRDRCVRQVQSAELFADAQELEIEHNGALYRLRKTSLGKLILTK